MKQLILFIALLTVFVTFSQNRITSEKKQKIEEYINHFEKNDQLMGNVSIFENGKEIINSTFGQKNIADNNIKTRKYTIGSITKMFTAVLFVKFAEENKLQLNEKLSTYFPEVPNAEKIELIHMLSHTSGLKDYTIKNDSLFFWLTTPQSKTDIVNEIIRQGVLFEPGDSLSYSNSAYYLLARILEKNQNKPYPKIITDEITTKLGLKNTFAIDENSKFQNTAGSYEKRNKKWEEIEEFYFPNASGAGDIISDARDLNRFLNALFTHQIISPKSLKKMIPSKENWFGKGLMKVPFYEYISYGHGGDTYGTHAIASYNPNTKLAISYIINGENYPTNDFAIGLLSILYNKEFELPNFEEYSADTRFYDLYKGNYSAEGFPITIKIYEENETLMARGKGQPAFILTPVERHAFEFRKAGVRLEFEVKEQKMMLEQAGQKFVLKKL